MIPFHSLLKHGVDGRFRVEDESQTLSPAQDGFDACPAALLFSGLFRSAKTLTARRGKR